MVLLPGSGARDASWKYIYTLLRHLLEDYRGFPNEWITVMRTRQEWIKLVSRTGMTIITTPGYDSIHLKTVQKVLIS